MTTPNDNQNTTASGVTVTETTQVTETSRLTRQQPAVSTVETPASETPASETPASAAPAGQVTLTVDGILNGSIKVAIGTKVSAALKSISAAIQTTKITLRELANHKPVSVDRALTRDLSVVATEKASGS